MGQWMGGVEWTSGECKIHGKTRN